jgi:PhnB protein
MPVKAVPEGWHTVTPRLFVSEAAKLVDFLKHAFGATGEFRNDGPTEARIGDSSVRVSAASDADFPLSLSRRYRWCIPARD